LTGNRTGFGQVVSVEGEGNIAKQRGIVACRPTVNAEFYTVRSRQERVLGVERRASHDVRSDRRAFAENAT
jgi:hypothetical protein